tara:strand:- start:2436 stop:3770 length:1335 start_codon:yes stop_codon:yes gene_type:complete
MKPFIVVQGPVATRSGYGNHTRDLVAGLIKSDKYDIQIVSLPWGQCPTDALEADNKEHQEISKRIARANISKKPDIFIQVSVPNEFQAIGNYNIGITAGIETTHVPHDFIKGANNMDLVIATSEHSKSGFNVVYDKVDEKTKTKTGELKLETPIKVLFEGADLDVYKKVKPSDIHPTVIHELKDIKEDFCFLFVGHWLKGNVGQDRKDIGMMIKTLCEAFKRKSAHNRPGIILKTSHASFSILDRDIMMAKINQIIEPYGDKIPNIYLLHGDLSDGEMNSLYNHPKVKAMVSFTKGEGFGRPLLEFGLTGKPIIASNWSGHIDFLHNEYCKLLPGELTQVDRSAADKFILQDAKWFTVEYAYAAKVLQDVVSNYKQYLKLSRKQIQHVKDNFSRNKMGELFIEILQDGVSSTPKQIALKLPKLKKAINASNNKLTLPKLKKVNI